MNIIGGKDYYDWGLMYGRDEKVVLDRREWVKLKNLGDVSDYLNESELYRYKSDKKLRQNTYAFHKFSFCGKVYQFAVNYYDKFLWGKEMEEIGLFYDHSGHYVKNENVLKPKKGYSFYAQSKFRVTIFSQYNSVGVDAIFREENVDCPYPAALISYVGKEINFTPVINLGEIKFARVKSAQEAFAEIYNFQLNKMDEPPADSDILEDIEKVNAKGFDKRVSFRHRK